MIEYVKRLRRESPRDIVTVYIPEYVLGHWWEQVLHNQSALRLKARLLLERGVVVASVPYQLALGHAGRGERPADPLTGRRLLRRPGDARTPPSTQATAAGRAAGTDGATVPIADSRHREFVDVAGTLRAVTLRPRGTSLTMEADLWDGTGSVTLVWLGRRDIPGIRARPADRRARPAGQRQGRAHHLQPALRAAPGPD